MYSIPCNDYIAINSFSVGLVECFRFGDVINHAAVDVLVYASWSTCALRMEFWGYLTIIQRPEEHIKELEICTLKRGLQRKELVFQSTVRRKSEFLVVPEVRIIFIPVIIIPAAGEDEAGG